jgi:hypothetical protein
MLKINLTADLDNLFDYENGKYKIVVDPLNNQNFIIGSIVRIGNQLNNQLFRIEEVVQDEVQVFLVVSKAIA